MLYLLQNDEKPIAFFVKKAYVALPVILGAHVQLSQTTTIIVPEKLRDYVLNPSSLEGESKARFLGAIGYQQSNWQVLERDLRQQHLAHEALPGKTSIYGSKYEILAPLIGPNGRTRWIRSIWIIRRNESVARFITLIPEKQP